MTSMMIPIVLAAALGGMPLAAADEPQGTAAAEQHPVKDAVTKSKILASFAVDPNVSVLKLDVQVENGVVQLGGTATSSTERDLAVEIARGTEGVREVHSQIALKDPSAGKPRRSAGEVIDDATLTAKVKSKLIANGNTPGGRISVTTRNAVVTLAGTVDTAAQKDLAGRLAENTEHVAQVHNEISIAPH